VHLNYTNTLTEDSQNPHQTDQNRSDDDFDLNLIRVTIHNLSQGGTILERSDYSDENSWRNTFNTIELINTVASRLSLYDRYWPYGDSHSNIDDDEIIFHTRSCCLGTSDYEGNGYLTPECSPHNHVEFNYIAPYKTSQQARDHLLNHNDVLADENGKL
jgi:hypothetical protein